MTTPKFGSRRIEAGLRNRIAELEAENERMKSALMHIVDCASEDGEDPLPDHMEYIGDTARRGLGWTPRHTKPQGG